MTAFLDVTVVPMDTERVLTNQTVLVEGHRITVLGPTDQVKVPAGAVRIDGRGKYLMPGLADMHIDAPPREPDHLLSLLASGVTAYRPFGVANDPRSSPIFSMPLKWRHPQAAKDYLGPYMYLGGSLQLFATPGLSADSVAAAFKAAGYNFVATLGPDSLMAAARRLGLPVATHEHTRLPFDSLPPGGSSDHLYGYWYALGFEDARTGRSPRSPATSSAKLREVAAAAQRAEVWTVPTLDCHEHVKGYSLAEVKLLRQFVKALQDAGAGLLLGAEGFQAYRELAALVRAGLTPYQALRTATYNPAQFLGLLGERGTVAVGKHADLVLLSGNPLQDIRYTREPVGVMLAGRWLDRAALDQHLFASPKALRRVVFWAGVTWEHEAEWPDDTLGAVGRRKKVDTHLKRLDELADSLEGAKSSGQGDESTYRHVLQLLAAELGVMRVVLTPGQLEPFDVVARRWLREQARWGYRLMIPGVAPNP